jgi:hypothetical protein
MTGNLLRVPVFGVLLNGDLDLIGLLQTSSISLSGVPLAPKDVQQVSVDLGCVLCLDEI